MEAECKWTFAELSASHYHNGPQDAMIGTFKLNPYAALIREACQNSCDALDKDRHTKVRMVITSGSLDRRDYPQLFDLREHINGCLTLYPNDQDTIKVFRPMQSILNNAFIPYFKISDFNTTGMTFYKTLDGKPKGSFYAFVRSGGHSEKNSTTAGGSFGFGKAAYFQISQLRSILVSTRTTDNKNFFEGIAAFCTHKIGDNYYDGHGFFDSNNGAEPNTQLEDIPIAFRRTEPGTDFYILGTEYTDEFSIKKEMVKAALRYFWTAIIEGKLELVIDSLEITKETFSRVMDRYFPEEADEAIRNHFYNYNPRPYADAYRHAGTSENFRVVSDDLPLLGEVKLYVSIDPSVNRDKIIYMRQNKMVIQSEMLKNHYGAYCVFICESQRGNELLRKLENASHDKWDKSNYTINNVPCKEGKEALKEIDTFVQDSLRSIFDRESNGTLEVEGLSDYLSTSESLLDEFDSLTSQKSDELFGVPTENITDTETGSLTTSDRKGPQGSKTSSIPPNVLITGNGDLGTTISDKLPKEPLTPGKPDPKEPRERTDIKIPKEPKPKKPRNTPKTPPQNASEGRKALLTIQSRMIAQKKDNVWWHYIMLNASRDASNVKLFFKAAGEDSSSDISIAEAITTEGKSLQCAGDMVSGISLNEGKNTIKIRMDNNLKYTLIFDGYEA